MLNRFLSLLALAAAIPLLAQAPAWEAGTQYIPSSPTVVRSVTSHLTQLDLQNTSGSSVTVTLADLSTNCGGSACTIWSASVPANTYWAVPLNGQKATNGFTWVAGTASAISGYIKGNY